MASLFLVRGRAAGLVGRRGERDVLDRLTGAVRAGESRALVVRGEPGVGKTALLDYVAERASGCRVARATGVQSEMELAFAGLHQLLASMLDRLEHLPGPQRDALRTATDRLDAATRQRRCSTAARRGQASRAARLCYRA
jgi:predicted ATPase